MSTTLDCYVHIPFIQVDAGGHLVLGNGNLTHVAFEEWLTLEDPSFAFQENRYSRAAPVFFCKHLELQDDSDVAVSDSDAIEAHLLDDLRRLEIALLFTVWDVALPGPDSFATYLHFGSGRFLRRFGRSERELLFEDPANSRFLGREELATVERVFSRLTAIQVGSATPELLRLVDAIKVGSHPCLTLEDLIVHFVSVQEDLLNAGGRAPIGKLTETYARRSAALYSPDFDSVRRFQTFFSELYSLRSAIVHGKQAKGTIQRVEQMLSHGLFSFLLSMTYTCFSILGSLVKQYGTVAAGMRHLMKDIDSLMDNDRTAFENLRSTIRPNWILEAQ